MIEESLKILLAASVLLSCQTLEEKSAQNDHTTCEDQLAKLPGFETQVEIIEKTKQAGGYILSYAATGAGYTADAIVFIAEGVVKTVIYCPAYLVMTALGHLPMHYCDPKNPNDKVKGTKFGKNIYGNTKDLRTANYLPLSRAILKTSSCFESRGDAANLAKARVQLDVLKSSELFPLLPDQEKKEIENAISRINSANKTE